LEKTPPRSSAA